MITIPEVKEVEVGTYLMRRLLKVRFVEVYSHDSQLFWRGDITGGTVDAAIAKGARFYGPIQIARAGEGD